MGELHTVPWLQVVGGYLATLAVGVVVGIFLYGRLLRRLRDHHPDTHAELGRPTLFMHSPVRGLTLQRFIYSRGIRWQGDPELRRLCRIVAVFMPLLLVAVFGQVFWWLRLL